jgi:predicted nucleic acid-binding protein
LVMLRTNLNTMWRMPKLIIADTSCLIVLDQIGELPILEKIYTQVIITPEIQQEFSGVIPNWIIVQKVKIR